MPFFDNFSREFFEVTYNTLLNNFSEYMWVTI